MTAGDPRQAHVESWLEALESPSRDLTPWEAAFLDSLREQVADGRALSARQLDVLERIYATKTP